jgi:hypothetical protein
LIQKFAQLPPALQSDVAAKTHVQWGEFYVARRGFDSRHLHQSGKQDVFKNAAHESKNKAQQNCSHPAQAINVKNACFFDGDDPVSMETILPLLRAEWDAHVKGVQNLNRQEKCATPSVRHDVRSQEQCSCRAGGIKDCGPQGPHTDLQEK